MDFRLLGPLEVVEHGRSLVLGGAKQRALLAVLLLHANEVVPTERLIDELWGESPPATVAKSVQVYVSRLRKELGDGRLATSRPGYILHVAPDELDLARFERLVGEADGADPKLAAERLGEALALWRGPPLADLAYEPFAHGPIARLEEVRVAALERRVDADLARGRHAELAGELEALVAAHPLRERFHGQLMLALYRCGRQAEALEAYRTARTALVEELGIEPGRELRELHRAILQQDAALDVAPRRRGFVGRAAELAELVGGLDDVVAGSGRLFLLAGEPGIGKSRLGDEAAAIARERGARVLTGRCWEAGGAPAYWPWTQALRAYMRETHDHDHEPSAQLGSDAADLLQLVPDLAPPSPLDPEGERFRLFDATAQFLRNASKDRPIMLVLDDLHAADEPSLLLLRFVARELASMRVLVVGAYRDVDPTLGEPLIELLGELAREPVVRRLALGGMSEPEVARYVELTAPEIASPDLAAVLYERTEGNPLFVGEIVRLLAVESGRRLAIPPSVRAVIARRLTHLSPESNRLLLLASVLGREFDIDALARMGGVTEAELLDRLDDAFAARVISDARGHIRFAHALIRDTLYEGLSGARRASLHKLAVRALERLEDDRPGSQLPELARHAVAARDAGKGLRYARRAAERALEVRAYEEAARLFRLTLEALELRQPVDAAARCELLLAIGDALAKAGRSAASQESFLAACDLAREASLTECFALAALGYGGTCGWQRAGKDARIVPLLEEALTAVGPSESSLRARLLARLAGALRDQPALEPRASLSREAVRIARGLGDEDTLAYALAGLFMATWGPDVDELVPIADEVTRLAHETGAADIALDALTMRGILAWTTHGQPDAASLDDEYEALAATLKQPGHGWQVAIVGAAAALFLGDLAKAEQLAAEALEGGQARSFDADCSYRLAMFLLRREQGRLAEIEDLILEAVDEYPGYRSFRCFVPLLHCELGRDDEARHAFDELSAAEFAALPRDSEWLFCLSILAEVAARLRDRDRAAVLYRLLRPYARLNAMASGEVAIGSVARYLGILAATIGRWDEAAGHFEDAIAMNARMGARLWLDHARDDYARMPQAARRSAK
jgi:DNA-binding SARP family transcriptional activator